MSNHQIDDITRTNNILNAGRLAREQLTQATEIVEVSIVGAGPSGGAFGIAATLGQVRNWCVPPASQWRP